MSEKENYTLKEAHRKFAAQAFNQTWDWMEKSDRTPEEDELLVHTAHASRYHWSVVGEPLNFQRGEWLLSRAYCVLRRGEPALRYARSCLKLTMDNDIKGFDLAFAYEAMTRASFVAGDRENADKYRKLAEETGNKIEKKEDREWFFQNLETSRSESG